MLAIIDRYLIRETFKSFLAILGVLMLIMVAHGFMKLLQKAAAGLLGNDVLMQLIGLHGLKLLPVLLPPAFFFSILYTLGRMFRDGEITALMAGGVSMVRIYRAYLILALPVAAFVGWLTLGLSPWIYETRTLIEEAQAQTAQIGNAIAGRFTEFSQGELVFYVEGMSDDRKVLRNIFVQNRQHGRLGIVTAREGYQYEDPETGDRYVVLTGGYRYEGEPGRQDYSTGQFAKYGVRIHQGALTRKALPPNARPTGELLASDRIEDLNEYEYRLLFPLSVVVFAMIAIPLSQSLPREGIYGRLGLALLAYFLFLNLQAISGSWMLQGTTPLWLGRWWVHPVMLAITALIFYLPPLRRRMARR